MLMRRFISLALSLSVVLGGGGILPAGTAPAEPAQPIPAPLPGAPQPTINLTPNHGVSGQTVMVSGQGVSPYPGVRVAWLLSDVTQTAAVATVQAGNAYSATISIPATAAPGPAKVCAAVTGTAMAAFACADFTVDAPAPGSVQGQIPLTLNRRGVAAPQALNAVLNLYDQQGQVIASAPIQANGSFSLGSVPPGSYTAGVAGEVPTLVQTRDVQVQSGQPTLLSMTTFTECLATSVVGVRMMPTGRPTAQYDFGTYVSFWPYSPPPNPIFEADLQVASGAAILGVGFKLTDPDGSTGVIGAPSAPIISTTYRITRTVGDFLPGISLLTIEPIASYTKDGQPCSNERTATKRVNVIRHPMTPNSLQYNVDRRILDLKWDGSRYVFAVKVPGNYDDFDIISPPPYYLSGNKLLPSTFPDPPPGLPYFGTTENTHGSAAVISGTLDLNGNVTFTAVRARAGAIGMSQDTIDDIQPLIPEGGDGILVSSSQNGPSGLAQVLDAQETNVFPPTFDQLRQIRYDFKPDPLFPFDKEIPVYEGVLFSAYGLANVRISIVLGLSGELVIRGTLRPLAPALDVTATANIRPRVDISVMVDALFGVVAGGGTTRTEAELRFPARMNTDDSRVVWLEDPCMRLRVTLFLWVRANLVVTSKEWNLTPVPIADYTNGSCAPLPAAADAAALPQPPRLLAAPAVASGPGGQMLSVYVEDSAPSASTPAPKVMARFWDTLAGQWGAATPLTDGSHMVQDAVAAFFGASGSALVAWTENPITLAEEQAAGNDLNAILQRQELYYAIWNGSAWGAPVRLTNDMLPDGRASLAGDDLGATLAWVRDADGALSTRTDWRIAVQEWNGSAWGAMTVLSPTINSMNAQVSAARSSFMGVSRRALAWTTDTDGDLQTSLDRQIAIADWNGTNWTVAKAPSPVPTRVDSPSLALVPQSQDIYLAFLRRSQDGNGNYSGLGNQGVLWSARRTGSSWQAGPVNDENGQPVRAERPQVSVSASGEPLLLFRRFGQVGTNGELGQLALSQLASNGTARPPLYLTDEPRLHWMPALAINQMTGQAFALNVGRPVAGANSALSAVNDLKPAAQGARPALSMMPLATSDDPVESMVMASGADAALDPALELSQLHAPPSSTVVVTATVRNLGRATASAPSVSLYAGSPVSGSLIATKVISALNFNASQVVTFTVTTASGEQPISAEVTSGGGNTSTANDRATAALGALLPPSLVSVSVSPRYANALEVVWQPPAVTGIAGYRILRSQTPGGPYELVGEATGTVYADLLLQRDTTYYYVVQTYDANGVVSGTSTETSGVVPFDRVYLPAIRR